MPTELTTAARVTLPIEERPAVIYPLLIFILFSAIFILLRSNDLFKADGAVRCLGVFHQQHLYLDENNHILYPANVFIWTRMARLAGFNLSSVQSFFSIVGLMNCFAAAGCLALFFEFSYLATLSNPFAAAVSAGLGFTGAFLLHATNPSEPMVAVFWSFLALYLAVRSYRRSSRWPAFFSGVLFALAMATYQSTVLLGPVAVVILWKAARPRSSSKAMFSKILNLSVFAAGALAGCVSIYGFIARFRLHSGSVTAVSALRGLFQDPGTRAFFGLSYGKLLNLPLGFLRNCYPVLPKFADIRGFLSSSPVAAIFIFLLLATFAALALCCAIRVFRLWNLLDSRTRTAILCGLVGAAFTIVPLVFWDSQYDKLWILPLASLILLLGISFRVISAHSRHPLVFAKILPAFLLLGLLFNLGWVFRARASKNPELRGAQWLSANIAPGDLFVGGWDDVSVVYEYVFAPPNVQLISFTSDAVRHGPQALDTLQRSVNATLAGGHHVFFLGLLDETKQSWDSFLGSRCGVPYSSFNIYRTHSVPYASLQARHGPLVLEELDFRDTPLAIRASR